LSVASMEPLVPTISERAPEPAPVVAEAAIAEQDYPIAPPREPRRRQRGGRDRGTREAKPVAETPTPAPEPRREPARAERQPARADRDQDDDRRVVGFGSDLPAFLARPYAPPPKA
jgi:hypothetical protein